MRLRIMNRPAGFSAIAAANTARTPIRLARLRKGFDPPGHLVAGPHEMRDSFCRTSLQLRLNTCYVGAGTEGAPRPRDDDDPNGGVDLDVVQRVYDRRKQLVAERV
jgi:hypothetical protein